jgi:hypothetical protein
MNWRKLVPVGRLGRRARKACVAAGLFACTGAVSRSARNPAFDGWWDAFNWPQLFLYAPVLFLFGVAAWQLICFIAGWFNREADRKTESLEPETVQETQRTLKFWLRDSLRVLVVYITACVIGDIPMAVNYVAAVRGWPLHWWWLSAVNTCLLLTVTVWWILERIHR